MIEYQIIDARNCFIGGRHFDLNVALDSYAYYHDEYLDERWARALEEELKERRTGNMTNWERYHMREFIEKRLPLRVLSREVGEWQEVEV